MTKYLLFLVMHLTCFAPPKPCIEVGRLDKNFAAARNIQPASTEEVIS